MKVCPKCNGTGWLKHERVQNGICFKCDGLGDLDKTKEVRARKAEKAKINDIKELKETVAFGYWSLNNTIFESVKKQRKQIADKAYKRLIHEYKIKMDIEEIKELANKIN
jgi:DnaJ-class molecular chaperone